MALQDPAERELLSIELARRGIVAHDNTVDYLVSVIRAGAMTAQYLIASGTRRTHSDAAVRMSFLMNWLWGRLEPASTREPEPLAWLDHSVVTLAAFSPSVNQLAEGALARMGSVAFLDALEESDRRGGLTPEAQALVATGRSIAERVAYNAVSEARQARNPWWGIEELNGLETPAGDDAIFALAGGRIDLEELGRVLESGEAFDELAEQWSPSADAELAHGSAHHRLVTVPRPRAADLIAAFETAPELRERDRRGEMLVWFGTDRAPTIRDGEVAGFGNEASCPRKVHYGRCLVTVPEAHRFGEVRTPWWAQVVRRSKDGTLRLKAIESFDGADAFAASVNATLAEELADEHAALIYVHGYNTTFEAAATRTAQLGFDLNVEGITGFYTWPSAAKAQKYPRDADNVAASEPSFSEFLDTITSKTDVTRLNIIVHSMGNRLVAEALQAAAPTLQARGVKFGAVVLAAPDINVDRFRQVAAVYPHVAESTTMYVSERDRALGASRFIWDSPRAGLTPPVTVVPGVYTIEVTDIDVSRLGHGYYAAAHPVLYDIREVLRGIVEPRQRVRLRQFKDPSGTYWQLRP